MPQTHRIKMLDLTQQYLNSENVINKIFNHC